MKKSDSRRPGRKSLRRAGVIWCNANLRCCQIERREPQPPTPPIAITTAGRSVGRRDSMAQRLDCQVSSTCKWTDLCCAQHHRRRKRRRKSACFPRSSQ
ncbi:hypothetical protein FQA47_001103 [Oryzias melastigma]|uniref:Uncharacterized protein n=1 Tax=Oryzias melastigma TaxID=30732 RepID=A0A834BPA8_ORYME|nr:hypothetical protein FQA47_001103 [Oryzias melastigma]